MDKFVLICVYLFNEEYGMGFKMTDYQSFREKKNIDLVSKWARTFLGFQRLYRRKV